MEGTMDDSMVLSKGFASPVISANPDAVREGQVVATIDVQGAGVRYQGSAWLWDTSKAQTIAMVFSGPWQSKRTIDLFLWSNCPVSIDVFTSVSTSPQKVQIQSAGTPSGQM